MIQTMQTLATGLCRNCHGKIALMIGSAERGSGAWYHEFHGSRACPTSPVAEPIEDTVTQEPCDECG